MEQTGQDAYRKQLGYSSQQLRLEDFELMKTLGTGMLEHAGPRTVMGTDC